MITFTAIDSIPSYILFTIQCCPPPQKKNKLSLSIKLFDSIFTRLEELYQIIDVKQIEQLKQIKLKLINKIL